jgi:hypothetical protein
VIWVLWFQPDQWLKLTSLWLSPTGQADGGFLFISWSYSNVQ